MPVDMTTLADDVAAETTELRLMIAGLDESGWRQDTPAAGWTVADQVGHLAYFDDAAVTSATDPDEFAADLERAVAEGATSPDAIVERYRVVPPAELLVWFDESRARLLEVFRSLDPSVRVPWFGPPMSAASLLTARLMETWAHGQDIADALGVVRQPTGRLKHVAHIGVGARAFSYAAHGRPRARCAGTGGTRGAERRDLGVGAGGRRRPGQRTGTGLLPRRDAASAPRRRRAADRGSGSDRVDVDCAGVRRSARAGASPRSVRLTHAPGRGHVTMPTASSVVAAAGVRFAAGSVTDRVSRDRETGCRVSEPSGTAQDWTEPGAYLVAPDVWRIPAVLPLDGLRAVNIYVLTDAGGLTLIDGGWALDAARQALVDGLAQIGAGLGDIKRFLVTHAHRDHYTNAIAVRREFGTPVLLGAGERATIDTADRTDSGQVQRPAGQPDPQRRRIGGGGVDGARVRRRWRRAGIRAAG